MRKMLVIGTIILFASGTASAQSDKTADLPYAGKWKLNFAKSDFGETTIAFTKEASGQMQFTTMGQSYTFQVDGNDYPALFGRTAAWKKNDANTWEATTKQDGKLILTETTKLSADGKALTVNASGPKPAGGTFEETVVYERLSGGPGLEGKWKTKNIKGSAPTVLELAPSGADVGEIGVVWSPVSAQLYGGAQSAPLSDAPYRGITYALMRAHLPYRSLTAENLTSGLNGISTLLLPNVTVLSDSVMDAIRQFVRDGGNLVATGHTSLYRTDGTIRSNFGLSDVFGVDVEGAAPGRLTHSCPSTCSSSSSSSLAPPWKEASSSASSPGGTNWDSSSGRLEMPCSPSSGDQVFLPPRSPSGSSDVGLDTLTLSHCGDLLVSTLVKARQFDR